MPYFTKTEIEVERIEEAVNFINSRLSVEDPTDSIHVTLTSQDILTANTLNPLASSHAQNTEPYGSSDQNKVKIPSELISHCVARLLKIQVHRFMKNFLGLYAEWKQMPQLSVV